MHLFCLHVLDLAGESLQVQGIGGLSSAGVEHLFAVEKGLELLWEAWDGFLLKSFSFE